MFVKEELLLDTTGVCTCYSYTTYKSILNPRRSTPDGRSSPLCYHGLGFHDKMNFRWIYTSSLRSHQEVRLGSGFLSWKYLGIGYMSWPQAAEYSMITNKQTNCARIPAFLLLAREHQLTCPTICENEFFSHLASNNPKHKITAWVCAEFSARIPYRRVANFDGIHMMIVPCV
jgi:hypothetical protein